MNPLDWLRQAGAYRESDSDRDGFLSYAAEWHALSLGVYDGMRTWRARPKSLPDNEDVQAEPHYYTGGYTIGTLIQWAILLTAAYNGVTGIGLL